MKKIIVLVFISFLFSNCTTLFNFDDYDVSATPATITTVKKNETVSFSVKKDVVLHLRGLLARSYTNNIEFGTKIIKTGMHGIEIYKKYNTNKKGDEIKNDYNIKFVPGEYQISYSFDDEVIDSFEIYIDIYYFDGDFTPDGNDYYSPTSDYIVVN